MNNIVASREQLLADDLLIFARVAELGSFTAAGERLGRPKSTVSRRVSALEEQLGEQLLIRTTRQMRLTDFGTALLEHAQQVVQEVEAVQALSEQRKLEPAGRLRVSIPGDFAHLFLVDMFAEFAALYPAVSLDVNLSSRRVDLVSEGFDLAVRMGALVDDALLVARKLADMDAGLYASPDYLQKMGRPQQPEDLQEHKLLRLRASSGQLLPWRLQRNEQEWSTDRAGSLQANTPELLMHLAARGAGIVGLPHGFACAAGQIGRLERVLPDWQLPATPVWAVFPGRRLLPAKTRAFIDMLVAALKDL